MSVPIYILTNRIWDFLQQFSFLIGELYFMLLQNVKL